MQVVLVMFRSDGERRSFSVTRDVTTIGRREDSTLRIPIAEVSRTHARLVRDGESLRLEDLGSSNGTFLNGQRIEVEAYVQAGDSVQVGPIVFVVQVDGYPQDEELNPITAESAAAAAMFAGGAAGAGMAAAPDLSANDLADDLMGGGDASGEVPAEQSFDDELPADEPAPQEPLADDDLMALDDAPLDDAPLDDAPLDDAPLDDAPLDDAPLDDAPLDDAPLADDDLSLTDDVAGLPLAADDGTATPPGGDPLGVDAGLEPTPEAIDDLPDGLVEDPDAPPAAAPAAGGIPLDFGDDDLTAAMAAEPGAEPSTLSDDDALGLMDEDPSAAPPPADDDLLIDLAPPPPPPRDHK